MNIKKALFISIIFFLLIHISTAYAENIDTLKSRLENATGREKIEILNELAGAYWEIPPNTRIAFAEQSIELSEEFHDEKSKADAYNHLGVAYNNLGDSQKSMDYFLRALNIMEEIDDKNGIANSYLNIGQANFYLDNFDKALEYFQKNLNLRYQIGDKKYISQALSTIGNVMSKTDKYDEALEYYFKALEISNEINDKMGISQLYNNIGNVYLASGEMERVLEYRLKSLQIVRELDDKWEIALTTYNIAEYFLLNNQPENAYPYILESLELAKYLENTGLILDNMYSLSLYYELSGDYQKALKYQRDFTKSTKKQFSVELNEKIAEMQIKYETEKKEKENQSYKLQLEKAHTVRWQLTMGILIILLIAFIIYYLYHIKKKRTLLLEELVAKRTQELQQKISEIEKVKENLHNAHKKLEKHRNHLEELVKERTKELEEKTAKLEKSQQSLALLLEDVNESRAELDISNKKLENSNKELEAFAYSVSHDLRAPLRAIDGFTRILMEDYVEKLDDEGKRLGAVIRNNSRKMGKLIDELLAFSRLGRASMKFSSIDMKNMAKAIYHEATSNSERKRINFSVADLPDADGDSNMFRQVWMNLISNAIKFSSKKEKAVISITGIQDDEKITYRISDNGAGFDMQYKNKIFDVFQRLHNERDFPGTGVGLALVRRIINRHNGKIWAEGKVDKGASFYFSLPKKVK